MAVRTARRHAAGAPAMVAVESIGAAMPGQVRAAVIAIGLPAAFVADQHRRIAAPVSIDQYLFAAVERLSDPFDQFVGQTVFHALPARIVYVPVRLPGRSRAFGQKQQPVSSTLGVVK